MAWYICKCGHEEEIYNIDGTEQVICPLCHRIGCWIQADNEA